LKPLRSSGVLWIAGVLLLGTLFLVRPGVQRLRARIAGSISLALGRPVEISGVSLHLLPRPGFDLENFIVHDDPVFSAEPILRAGEVSAALRVTSLLRGRLEIARLSLGSPSLNLVRDGEGHWNVENLVERAAKTPVAPTGKSRTETRPGFPYIEADNARINFKFGQEKKPYALTDSEFGFWQDSENSWGMRLSARPVRTDFNLSDTGTLQVDGTWGRAASLRETPVQFNLQWTRGQLGQITKLFFGHDRGWRGEVSLAGKLSGSPGDLQIETTGSVSDFRRYDISGGDAMRLATRCGARYNSATHEFTQLSCQAPIGTGSLMLAGSFAGSAESRSYDLALTAVNIPMSPVASLVHRMKKDLPADLIAAGKLDGEVTFQRARDERAGPEWHGSGEISGAALQSKLTGTNLNPGRVPFSLRLGNAASSAKKKSSRSALAQGNPRLDFGPFNLGLPETAPVVVTGWIGAAGYGLQVQGDADLQTILQVARTAGVGAPQPAADGFAKIDLQISGGWRGFVPPKVLGSMQLRDVRAEVSGLSAPLEIPSASVSLMPDEIDVRRLSASLAGSSWHGWLVLPRPCGVAGACPVQFDLRVDQLATDRLAQLASPHSSKRPWYRFLSSSEPRPTYLGRLRAAGKLSIDHLSLHKLEATRVSARVDLDQGRLRLADVRGEVFGGKHTGQWLVDFAASPRQYSGTGELEQVALPQLASAMHDDWVTGTAAAGYRLTAFGTSLAQLLSSASGELSVDASEATLPHVMLTASKPLHLRRLAGRFLLREGKFHIEQGTLTTANSTYQINGTASLVRNLDLNLTREGGRGFVITGTLAEPHVNSTPETRAALKP
jgi:uncharacterized protein involved in outer membrane biogenesis